MGVRSVVARRATRAKGRARFGGGAVVDVGVAEVKAGAVKLTPAVTVNPRRKRPLPRAGAGGGYVADGFRLIGEGLILRG